MSNRITFDVDDHTKAALESMLAQAKAAHGNPHNWTLADLVQSIVESVVCDDMMAHAQARLQ